MEDVNNNSIWWSLISDELKQSIMTVIEYTIYGNIKCNFDTETIAEGNDTYVFALPESVISPESDAFFQSAKKEIPQELKSVSIDDFPKGQEANAGITMFALFANGKLITLTEIIRTSYYLYHSKDTRRLCNKPSKLLDPRLTPELRAIFMVVAFVMSMGGEKPDAYLKNLYDSCYKIAAILLEILSGFLPCDEVKALHVSLNAFFDKSGSDNVLADLMSKFSLVASAFAVAEPKWEEARQLNKDGQERKKPGPKGKHLAVSVEEAAHAFGASEGAIGNWDKEFWAKKEGRPYTGKGHMPEGYPGRENRDVFYNFVNTNKGRKDIYQ